MKIGALVKSRVCDDAKNRVRLQTRSQAGILAQSNLYDQTQARTWDRTWACVGELAWTRLLRRISALTTGLRRRP